MSINDFSKKIKPYLANKAQTITSQISGGLNVKEDIFIVSAIILIGLAGFGLGKLSALEKGREPVSIKSASFASSTIINQTAGVQKFDNIPLSAAALVASDGAKGLLVASKSGTRYHFPWCAGASQITEKNKIWFDSYDQAQIAGYTPAANCKGLK